MRALQGQNGSNLESKDWLGEKTENKSLSAGCCSLCQHSQPPARLSSGKLRAISLPGLQISSEEPTRKQERQGTGDLLEETGV